LERRHDTLIAVPTLAEKFAELRERREKALVLFLTAGDQPLGDLPELIGLLAEAGADVIEVGLPFSDPFGEGPTIQASSQRALDHGATPRLILEQIGRVRASVPLVTMGYYNPVLRFGLERFAKASSDAGVTGTIISDLVPDEADGWRQASAEHGIETIFLVAPTSSEARIHQVANGSTGFVYVVSRTGVTGAENQVPADVAGLVGKVKALTDKPVCVGFGISTPEHVSMVCKVADGAVVGSAIVNRLHEEWPERKDRIVDFVKSLKQATLGHTSPQ
jgi:tryptophan synthase alpha chain